MGVRLRAPVVSWGWDSGLLWCHGGKSGVGLRAPVVPWRGVRGAVVSWREVRGVMEGSQGCCGGVT